MSNPAQQLESLLGVSLRPDWLQSVNVKCPHATRDQMLTEFLNSDMETSSSGCLPTGWEVRGSATMDWVIMSII